MKKIPSTPPGNTRRAVAAALGAALLSASSVAGAEGSAEALFRSGRDLIAEGRYAEGCPKFEASFALAPSTGTLLNIARCHEHDGKIATAWEDYKRALVLNHGTKEAERQRAFEEVAKKALAALEPRLPRLQIVIHPRPAGLEVLRDGKKLPEAALGEALPGDPGPHEIRVTAPGYRPETRSVTLEERRTATLDIPLVAPDQAAPSGGVPVWAWATGGVGVALAGAGVFFLTQDLAAIRALRDSCYTGADGTSSCKPGYSPDSENARKNRSFALFLGLGGAGVVAIGAAVVGIVLAPSAKKPASAALVPWAGPGGAGLVVQGGF